MSIFGKERPSSPTRKAPSLFPRLRRRVKPQRTRAIRGPIFWLAFLPLILLSGVLSNWIFLSQTAFAAPTTASSASGYLTAQQSLAESQQSAKSPNTFKRPPSEPAANKLDKNAAKNKPLPSAEPAAMKDGIYTLDDSFVLHRPTMKTSVATPTVVGTAIPAGTTPLQFKGSDGRLEIDLPRGSLDFSQAKLADGSAPVGQLQIKIHQLTGHSIASESYLGFYQIQVVDSQGSVVQGVQVVQPYTIVYHYQLWEMKDLNLNPSQIHLTWPDLISAALAAKQPTTGLDMAMTSDTTAHTLTAQSHVLGVMTAAGPPALEPPTKPDLFEASGNSGQYSYSYPINVVPGPDGFMPQLALSYSSQTTNSRYDARIPGGDEGDGWSLGLGSITMATNPGLSNAAQGTWYSINGVDGISDKMIPAGTAGEYVTEHYSHLLIVNYGSYWGVWDKDGTYYEFGNTQDSVQQTSAGTYEWDLDKMSAPTNNTGQVKTLFVRYYQDSPDGGTTIRDSGIDSIQYGMATSQGATSLSQIMGTVGFYYRAPQSSDDSDGQGNLYATAYGSNYHCSSPPSSTTMRCDDPVSYNGEPAPQQMPTLTLTSIVSYVGDDKNNIPAYRYDFGYQETPYTTNYYDPTSLTRMAAAGRHLLTVITPTVYVTGTAYPRQPVRFAYNQFSNSYGDHSQAIGSGHFGGQTYWQYLTWYEDMETGTGAEISYGTAYANMQGTPYTTDGNGNVTDDRYDPLYCFNNANNSNTSKQCTGSTYGYPNEMSWSVQVVTQIAALGTDSSGDTTQATTSYGYSLQDVDSSTMPVNSCNPITGSGVPAQEADCVTDTWVPGVASYGQDNDSNWVNYYDAEFRGFNIVYTTTPAHNLVVDAYFSTAGWWTPESNGANFNGGQQYEEKIYQGSSESNGTLLKETDNYYAGVGNTPSGNAYSGINTCNTGLSMTYDPCVVAALETKVFQDEGNPSSAPWLDTKYTYDDVSTSTGYISGKFHNLQQEVISGSNLPTSVYPLTKKWTYQVNYIQDSNNNVTAYVVDKVSHSETDDASGHVWQCQDTTYDEGTASGVVTPAAGWPTTQKSYTTCGNSSTALTSYTAYDQYGNTVATVDPVGAANPSLYSNHACTVTPTYVSAAWTAGHYTTCNYYDTGHSASLLTLIKNARNQSTTNNYDYTTSESLSSTVDLNGQTTSYGYSYDSSGNETIATNAPGESPTTYTSLQREKTSCPTSATLPCYEIDTNTSLYSTAITHTFYDQQGRAVETRTPGPTPGDDTVVATIYYDESNSVWKSEPFEVADGAGWINPTGVKDVNGNTPGGTMTFSDALGRTIAIQDLNYKSSQEPGLSCLWGSSLTYTSCVNHSLASPLGDSATYDWASTTDANNHVSESFTDAAGQTRYIQVKNGVATGTVAVTTQTATQYNALGKPTSVKVTDELPQSGESVTTSTTTMSYDDTGRLLSVVDPDQGTLTYTYDQDNHILSAVQTSGSNSRTTGYNYDLLGRLVCTQAGAVGVISWNGACSGGNPLFQNTYDTTTLGVQGTSDYPVGQLTQSVATTYYPGGISASVTEQFQHDQRARLTNEQIQLGLPSAWNVSAGLPTYQEAMSYNDANQVTTTSTTDGSAGYTFSSVYDPTNGVEQGLSNNSSLSTANLATLSYNEYAQLAGITLLNGASSSPTSVATEQYSYDADQRPTSLSASWLPGSGNSGQIVGQNRSYDNESNVTSLSTTFAPIAGQTGSGGSQTENFCYDEQNRLVWSGNGNWAAGTPQPGAGNGTCGSGTLGSTLGGSAYSAAYTYTNLGQIWQGPLNHGFTQEQYLYCNSASPHQLTGIYPLGTTCSTKGSATAVYSASYDPWGNQTTRTTGGVTGTLSYDQSNRMTEWNAGANSQEFYLYDAAGNRILKRSSTGTGTTLAVYSFGLEENDYTGTGVLTTQTHYYNLASHLIGSTNGTTTTFYMTDGLDSVLTAFGQSAIEGEQVYGPFGASSYQSGLINTAKGYTGQVHDGVSGLDYYVARYYDPVIGMFLSVDNVQGNAKGMDPYAYVTDNPETLLDPTGHSGWGGFWGWLKNLLFPPQSNADKFAKAQAAALSNFFSGKDPDIDPQYLQNLTPAEILNSVPSYAKVRIMTPRVGSNLRGVVYQWKDANGTVWQVEVHTADYGTYAGANARGGPTLRITQLKTVDGKVELDDRKLAVRTRELTSDGKWVNESELGLETVHPNEPLINSAHIPMAEGVTDDAIDAFIAEQRGLAEGRGTLTTDESAYGTASDYGPSGTDEPEGGDPAGE